MPLTVDWHDPERSIILVWGEDAWTWDDWHTALEQMIALAKSTARQVDFIYGNAPGTVFPRPQAVTHVQRTLGVIPENAGLHVIVNDKTFARAIMVLVMRAESEDAHISFHHAPSLAEARALIQRYRLGSGRTYLQ
ncbi:MAG: hypothetical protein KC547_07535 [Anaerolineae bacterium]|nr:hypothetical protein [Anaerolineae bacterium]MCA9909942.1 hypothetical protein [Anaerolineae bacterium]